MNARIVSRGVLGLTIALTLGCHRGDKNKCEQAVRNVFVLSFWHDGDKQLAKLPEAQRLDQRRLLEQKFDTIMKQDFTRIVSQCVAAGDDDRADCMIKADTCAKAKACMPGDSTVDISGQCQ